MRSAAALVLAVCTGCTAAVPSATATPTVPPPSASPSPSPTASVDVTPSAAAGIGLPEPGRPFTAAAILDAMRTSRRPGGVPDQLETDSIAATVAQSIWTFDGEPWTTMAIGGSCGTETCLLEVAGTRPGTAGEDLWAFEVTPATGDVTVSTAELRSLPTELVEELDLLTRAGVREGGTTGLALASVRWLPPPDEGRFVVSYRSGGEEGSCGADFTLDATSGGIVSRTFLDC